MRTLKALLILISSIFCLNGHAQSLLDSVANGYKFRSIGPAFMSGRISDIVIHPNDNNTWYVAVGSGGVWKTTNSGITWNPIFDSQKSYSIGCISIDPSNPHSVWVGTGENVGGRHVGYGDGIYHSPDDGTTWKNMGLNKSEHISKIIIHPGNSNVIWVAVQGPLWSSGGERGVYKTTDGGKTWNRTLFVNEWTGATDLVIDPRNPKRLYAATWQRHRTVAAYMGGGPGSGIHVSEDGGETWTKLKKGLPGSNMGKIGLAISPQQPDVLYAAIELDRRTGGVYRSADRGQAWVKMSSAVAGATGPHYYQELYASPHEFDKIYLVDIWMQISEDGGKTFRRMKEQFKHSDNHAIAWRADEPNYILVGCDGGLYESFDGEENWRYFDNLPTVQYYKVAVDDAEPFYNVYGGTQDNNTHGGPSRTDNVHGIRNADWFITLGGDGHQPATEPGNPDIVYSEWQQGNLTRIDRKSGERVFIQPQAGKGEAAERYNWDAPILVSPHNPTSIYFASQRVWKSDNRGDDWVAISGDLTRNEERITLDIMGAKQNWNNAWDIYAMSNYNTITSLAESPKKAGLIYAGTDDGILQITEDGGQNWRKVEVNSLPDCPDRAFVNDIKADLFDENTAYIVLDNHKSGDYTPYLYKTTDKGKSWKKLSGNLPSELLVWRIVQDHVKRNLLFLGTEKGVYASIDGGRQWTALKGGMPTIPVRDLAIQKRENDLVAATFGRGFYILDDYSSLRELNTEVWEREAHIFQAKTSLWYMPRMVLGGGKRASQGASYFVADNPAFGATFTYYLKDGYKSAKAIREEAEKKNSKSGKEYAFPGFDVLDEEQKALDPLVLMYIYDREGKVIRKIKAPAGKGLQRVSWDLQYAGTGAMNEENSGWGNGFMCSPGRYSAALFVVENGSPRKLAGPLEFDVKRVFPGALPGKGVEEAAKFWREVEAANERISAARMVLGSTQKKLEAIEKVLVKTPDANEQLYKQWTDVRKRVLDLEQELNGSKARAEIGELDKPGIGKRMGTVYSGVGSSSYGPTGTHVKSFEIARQELEILEKNLNEVVNTQLPALLKNLRAAGSPYFEGMEYPPAEK